MFELVVVYVGSCWELVLEYVGYGLWDWDLFSDMVICLWWWDGGLMDDE